MTLTDDEATLAFRHLAASLRELGLGWVVTQVEEKLALGKVQTRKLPVRSTPDYFEPFFALEETVGQSARKGAAPVFAVAEEYSAQERLDVLLESIELAVPVVSAVAEKTFDNLHEFGVEATLDFAPEAEVSEAYELSLAAVQERAGAIIRLVALLNELRGGETSANQTQPAR